MTIEVRRASFEEVRALRERHRGEADCQIVHHSALPRGLAVPWLVLVDGRTAGHAGVWNRYYEGRIVEFYVLPRFRPRASDLFREVVAASGATGMEAQTNMPLMAAMLEAWARDVVEEKILFEQGATTSLVCPGARFRRAMSGDDGPDGEWVLEAEGRVVAAGGVLYHYNPPYGDVYMEVVEGSRRRGFGSYLVQELKRVCREGGKTPAARCDPANAASRRTLEKAGFVVCGRLLAGRVGRGGEPRGPAPERPEPLTLDEA